MTAAIVPILPWTVMSMFLMTESLAYVLFLFAAWAIVRAVAHPTRRHEVIAMGLIAAATAARAQFLALVPIFMLTAVIFDVGRARRTGGSIWLALRERRMLWACLAASIVVVFLLTAVGADGGVQWAAARLRASGRVVGDVLDSSRQTFAVLVVMSGIAPVALGLAGAVSGIARPRNLSATALSIFAPIALVTLVISNASYTVRGLDALIHERFSFYVVPLLVPLAVQFLERPRAVRAALATALAITLVGVTAFAQAAGHHYSYAAPVGQVLVGRVPAGWASRTESSTCPPTWLLVPAAIAVCAVAALLLRRATPTIAVAAFAIAIVPFLLGSSAFDYNRALHPRAGDNIIGLRPDSDSGGGDWVDRALPPGHTPRSLRRSSRTSPPRERSGGTPSSGTSRSRACTRSTPPGPTAGSRTRRRSCGSTQERSTCRTRCRISSSLRTTAASRRSGAPSPATEAWSSCTSAGRSALAGQRRAWPPTDGAHRGRRRSCACIRRRERRANAFASRSPSPRRLM